MYKNIHYLLATGAPVTYSLTFVILIVSSIAMVKPSIFSRLILHPYGIVHHKEYYRLVTSDLVHIDWLHLALNEAALYVCCANLEEVLRSRSAIGSWQFLLIYLCSYFSGVIFSTIRHRNDFGFSSAGASGSIMGCMFSFMMLRPKSIAFYLPLIGGVQCRYEAFFYFLVLVWYKKKNNKGIANHELHLFGAIGGALATVLLFPGILGVG